MTTQTVAIVEDDDDTRAQLSATVTAQPELRLLAAYGSGRKALQAILKQPPDVLLVDLGLPDVPGLEIIKAVSAAHPSCDILVISVFGDEEHVIAALEAGARGFLLKGALGRDLAADIRELRNGGSPLSPIIARQVLKRLRASAGEPHMDPPQEALADDQTLTGRETEILRMIARGFSYAETGKLLNISVQTVHSHLKRIYRKLAVHSKTEAVFEADQRRLL
jgi:DNA-binding NarL/FixJ family response regulator